MKFDDFRKANCDLLRLPPLDVSAVARTIDETLLEAWKSGSLASGAIEEILEDKSVLEAVAQNMAPAMLYQRTLALAQVEEQQQQRLNEFEAQTHDRLQQVEKSLGTAAAQKEEAFKQIQQQAQETQQSYSAAEKRLYEMRERVRQRVERLGGEQALQTLMTIQSTLEKPNTKKAILGSSQGMVASAGPVEGTVSFSVAPYGHPYQSQDQWPEKQVESSFGKTKVPPPPSSLEQIAKAGKHEKTVEPMGTARRVWNKVYKVLTYKVW